MSKQETWRVAAKDVDGSWLVDCVETGRGVAFFETLEHATLAAAAPSMLQLLESIEEAWGDHADDVTKSVDPFELRDWLFDTLMPEVRQEIAKAKGTASDPL